MSWLRLISLWGPVVTFMVVVFSLAGTESAPTVDTPLDKALHAGAYALFGLLCLRACHGGFGPPRRWPATIAMLLAVLYGLFDEWHQQWIPTRNASFGDWAADALGAGVSLVLLAVVARRPTSRRDNRRTPAGAGSGRDS